MLIEFRTKTIQRVCTNLSAAEKKYGSNMAEKIHLRIDQLAAAESVEMMIQFKIGRCHHLSGNRKGQYALDLVHPYRMIFEKKGKEIQIARIVDITDYH